MRIKCLSCGQEINMDHQSFSNFRGSLRCHNYESMRRSLHERIPCESCHGAVLDHPSEPPKLGIDKSRAQCLRCHYPLKYPSSGRANIRGIDPEAHNPDIECVTCHNPHKPDLEAMR